MWLAVRERVVEKSPVREYRPPGSVRGAPGNRRPYRDCNAFRLFPLGVSLRPPAFSALKIFLPPFPLRLCVRTCFLSAAFCSTWPSFRLQRSHARRKSRN